MRLKISLLSIWVVSTLVLSLTILPAWASQTKSWTFMVYLDADNNLEEFGIEDMNEMEAVGSTIDVNIVVQIDRIRGYYRTKPDWTGARRYYVELGSSILIEDLGELNMGDPSTLIDFMEWTVDNYPADKYCLVMWDHGSGYLGLCWDDTDGDHLSIAELRSALYAVQASKGLTVDVITFDACVMGMLEVVYEIRSLAQIVVASEESVSGQGAPYDTILEDLTADPSMGGASLGQTWVQRYGEYYSDVAHLDNIATMAAIDTSVIDDLAYAVDQLASSFIDALPPGNLSYIIWRLTIGRCRRTVEEYGEYLGERRDFNTVDLCHFANISMENIPDSEVQDKAAMVMSCVDSAVIAEWHGRLRSDSHGISIFFPQRKGQYAAYDYPDIEFSLLFTWDEFLETYLRI